MNKPEQGFKPGKKQKGKFDGFDPHRLSPNHKNRIAFEIENRGLTLNKTINVKKGLN